MVDYNTSNVEYQKAAIEYTKIEALRNVHISALGMTEEKLNEFDQKPAPGFLDLVTRQKHMKATRIDSIETKKGSLETQAGKRDAAREQEDRRFKQKIKAELEKGNKE